jgi:uncharacterized DUF497 family protein
MKEIRYSKEKDLLLKKERNVSFQDIKKAFDENRIVAIVKNPHNTRYRNQKMFLVTIDNYIYVVPFVEDADHLFLKTIYPSKKYTKRYL